ncbi:BMP family ABC transporter substrate-binding protein [Streptobacillus felis]|uniref:BMP family ABC transporter substrate-binding protein n=1 Tax=Streptobacillus felis TaxID=1384509 RepID=A0A7Z0PF44_9FUSO|nr:BMP family ABC transporter substrate-binding protein [Streptobacillus felis]NYV27884.1 BMP family ABC transporter substrate-binding protein [Streptobacillus felis]
MKKIITLMTFLFFFVFSCGNKEEVKEVSTAKKIAIVYSTGGKGDKSFNDSAYMGIQQAIKDFGIEVSEYEPKDTSDEAKNVLSEYAQTGEYELIIGIGFTITEALIAVGEEYPNQKFVMIDDVIEGKDNVLSIVYDEQEGTFLTGALAAMMTKTNTIGFIGGVEAPVIYRFATGYFQGAKYIKPDINVLISYINGSDSFNDPVAAKQLTEVIISKGADVVMHAAGASGSGVFKAVEEMKVYGIGVDSNQDGEVPGYILTSMIKRVDTGVYESIKSVLNNEFKGGVKYLGVKDNGLGVTDFEFTRDIIGQENIDKINSIIEDIKSGKIVVDPNGPVK